MNKFLLVAICTLCTLSSMAQTDDKSVGSRLESRSVKVSIMGGMNVSTLVAAADGERSISSRRIGFQAGIGVDFPLYCDFYLHTGATFAQKGLKGVLHNPIICL